MKAHCTLSTCGWSVAEGVSFGTLQGCLIPEHGWLEERGGSGGERGGVGKGSGFHRPTDLTLNPWGVELKAAQRFNCCASLPCPKAVRFQACAMLC